MELCAVEPLRLGQVLTPVKPVDRRQWLLLAIGAAALTSIYGSPFPDLAPLQNIPTLTVLLALWFAPQLRALSPGAFASICFFLLLHTIGGRYAYSYVPYDSWFHWLGLAGPTEIFQLDRNHYDRLVHFAFGALLLRPLAELLSPDPRAPGIRAAILAVAFVLAVSALYEIFEWLLTMVMAPGNADAYNGQQGDMWDAQKDMAVALAGAIASAVVQRMVRTLRG